jgi:eukaryotic-like serine/threonine-protein kinase
MLLLGKYESLGILGSGSMGQVHACRPVLDPATTVVVKVLKGDVADTPRARQFFEREVAYTSRLRHPYIVRVLDHGFDPQAGPCLVLEFVPGHTLEAILKKERRLDPGRVGHLLGCLCHALEAAHTTGVIHRDLKPANLMIMAAGSRGESLKVMDFGLSQLATKPHLTQEQLGGAGFIRTQGTPAYIAPEQVRGDDVDGRADLYGTGVILFEALTGRLPFPYSTVDKLIIAHASEDPPRFAAIGCRDVDPAIEDVVRQCLAKFPAERPSCPRDLAVAYGRALGVRIWDETTPIGGPDGSAELPVAEAIPPEPEHDPNTVVRQLEAWMPDKIAIIKIGGFLKDVGGQVVHTEPGLLQAVFPPPAGSGGGLFGRLFGGKAKDDGIELDLDLDKPNPTESRLVVTATFHVPGGRTPAKPGEWAARCQGIFEELKKYLMAGG